MQLPEPPPPPLAPLWDRILRARTLPPDLDVQLLHVAIRDRLVHPEWEVRLNALRVLADLLPLSGNALSFPFDQVVDNLGHNSPNVRKAALDALKVFCTHCESPECAARRIIEKCSYHNIRPHSADVDAKLNVVTGLLLSLPSMMTILKRRYPALDTFPIFILLGNKLFDTVHRDVALRSLIKFRRVTGSREYAASISRLDPKVQDKFHHLCQMYDEDSLDVYYAPRRSLRDNNNQLVSIKHEYTSPATTPIRLTSESNSSDESFSRISFNNNNFAKVIIETEIKFDSDTAITMTVLEENATESDKNTNSEEDFVNSDRNVLKYSDGDSDTDVVVKKVRFGGESVKIRTPDSEDLIKSEDENKSSKLAIEPAKSASLAPAKLAEVSNTSTQYTLTNKANEIKRAEFKEREHKLKPVKKSGIPLPIIQTKPLKPKIGSKQSKVKLKSKSLSELYDYFRTKNGDYSKSNKGFALTLAEVRSPDKVPSPVESHREVEVLHNLQRSPNVSPRRRRQTRLHLEQNGFVLNLLSSSHGDGLDLMSPRPPSPLLPHYDWEEYDIVPSHVSDQLHNTENWIAAVKATDQLHSTLLEPEYVRKLEPAAVSLVQHMWALSDAVPAARAPAEGAVCALIRTASNNCTRRLLPTLISRMGREPLPAALPHALLQRLALHHLIDLIFDPSMIGADSDKETLEEKQLLATLCISRAAGPAAVLAAVRRRLAGSFRADTFCYKLRERLRRPIETSKTSHISRASQLPVPVRRRARSTPPPAGPPPPRRLRPLPDSAPLLGISHSGGEIMLKQLTPVQRAVKDSSAFTASSHNENDKLRFDDDKKLEDIFVVSDKTEVDITPEHDKENVAMLPPRSPSIKVEDYSERSNPSLHSNESRYESQKVERKSPSVKDFGSQKSLSVEDVRTESRQSRRFTPSPAPSKSRSTPSTPLRSRHQSPDSISDAYKGRSPVFQRDVRNALTECMVPARHEDWEMIVNGLLETERLAADSSARAPTTTWRAAVRAAAAHVRSLRSRVARAACTTVGALFEHRGRTLDTELEEATSALLERCADVNRFLRADAASALVRVACASSSARAAVALSRRGATHRAGPVRAAAAQALSKLVEHNGATRILNMPTEPRTIVLRAAGELLADAHPETRLHARHLCLALTDDVRFQSMLKEAMPLTRYRAIEKFVEKLR